MVFTILAVGYRPVCALDANDGAEVRVDRIARMIGSCDFGIHDLSRVEVAPGGLPRFNMPLELGIHLGARLFGDRRQKQKRALILDAELHRYDRTLSDISGQDVDTHENEPAQAIRCVRDWLSDHRRAGEAPLPGAVALTADFDRFRREVGRLLAPRRLDPEHLTHSDYLFAVSDWLRERGPSS
jgi:hypothetical protein